MKILRLVIWNHVVDQKYTFPSAAWLSRNAFLLEICENLMASSQTIFDCVPFLGFFLFNFFVLLVLKVIGRLGLHFVLRILGARFSCNRVFTDAQSIIFKLKLFKFGNLELIMIILVLIFSVWWITLFLLLTAVVFEPFMLLFAAFPGAEEFYVVLFGILLLFQALERRDPRA